MSGASTAVGLSAVAEPTASPHRWKTILGGGIIVLAALAAYHNSLAVPLLLDDHSSVEDNLTIRHLWPIWKALSPSPASFVGGRPVMNLSLAVNYALGGTGVWGYHGCNLAVHILAALTLFGIVRRTLLRPGLWERSGAATEWVALAVAVIWTVHPLQTRAVTYISERCEELMGLFYLLTMYCFIRGADSRQPVWWFTLSVVACLLGMASKEVMVTVPVMVLLYDRTFVSGSFQAAWTRHRCLYLGLASSWLFLGHLMTGLHDRAAGYGLGCTWWGYALTECRAVVQYLRLALWPDPLIFDYGQYVPTGPLAAAPYALILAVLATGVLFALKRQPAIGFVGAWFFVILAPTSSVVPIVASPMAEHRMYLPLASVVTLTVVGAAALGKRLFNRPQDVVLGCVASGSVVLLFAFLTIERNRNYSTALTIWQDTVEKRPNNPWARNSLGAVLMGQGRPQEATGHFEQAVRLKPDYAEAHNNLGVALLRLGKVPEAFGHFEQAVRFKPDFFQAQNNWGNALLQAGRAQEAIGHYEQALRIKPNYANAHNNLGLALARTGQVPEAIEHYEQALRIKPDYAEAHNNLANVLLQAGNVQEAIGHYEQALRLQPDFADAYNNLAWLLATHAPAEGGDAVRAVGLAQRACELTSDRRAGYLDTLAATYAAAGRFSDAIATAQKAVGLARSGGQPKLAGEYDARLELYRSGRAYRQAADTAIPNNR